VGTDGAATEVRRKREKHPVGWEPRLDTERGVIVTPPLAEAPADWDAILEQLLPPGIDPSGFQVDGKTVEVRAWDANVGDGATKRLYYFKARVVKRGEAFPDLSELVAVAKKARVKKPAPVGAERVYGVHITDLQAGQGDGFGVAGMVDKALQIAGIVADDLQALKKAGRPASQIFIPVTGDLVEGILGWYEMQTFSVQLDRRDQVKLVRRLLTEILVDVASHGLPVHVAVVPGNHGENRNNGKAYTTLGDNDDVAVVEQVAEAFALAGNLGHVSFSFPAKERLSLTVEVLGHVVGLTHGHVARAGAGVEGKILSWFKSMAASRDPIGDADLLFTGHYHHPRFQSLIGDTYWIQGGALCDTSAWFSQSFGLASDPCLIRFTMTRCQKVESVMPYFWPRTVTASRVIGE
jgi:predicted phosphodiesterase